MQTMRRETHATYSGIVSQARPTSAEVGLACETNPGSREIINTRWVFRSAQILKLQNSRKRKVI